MTRETQQEAVTTFNSAAINELFFFTIINLFKVDDKKIYK